MNALQCKPEFVAHTVQWPDMPKDQIVAWVLERQLHPRGHINQGAVNVNDRAQRERLDATGFPAWIGKTFQGLREKPDRFWTGYWDRTCKAGAGSYGGGWVSGFPHKHGWPDGFTVAMVVQAPTRGGASVLITPEGTEFTCMPVEGVGLVIEGDIEHGVKAVHGDIPRIVLIATIFPKEG